MSDRQCQTNEEWRNVPGYDGRYKISIATKEGKCKSLNYLGHKGVEKELSNKAYGTNNYKQIVWRLTNNGVVTSHTAARWIALTYPELIENEYFKGAEIDHKDTDTLNNHPSNLRWVDRKGNLNNPLTKQHKKVAFAQRERKGPFPAAVEQFSLEGVYIKCYDTIAEAHKKTGICRASISMCCNGKLKKAGNYLWKYKEKEAV